MNKLNKTLFGVLIFLLTVLFSYNRPAVAPKVVESEHQTVGEQIIQKRSDPKTEILQAYFKKHNSPLENHAQDFIDAAEAYDLDWRLVAAISGVESTFGKAIPGGYNGWGWGVYGTKALYFKSWRDGIFTVSQGLREKYVNKGLTNPYQMNRIYASSPAWGGKVTFFMNDIQKFADGYDSQNILADEDNQAVKIAARSATLDY